MNNTESKKSWQEEYGKVVGIDLGTTNSVIAAIEGGIPKIISNREGSRTTPSVVAFTKNEEIVVGQLARRQANINPLNTFFSVKRFIGIEQFPNQKFLDVLPYDILTTDSEGIKLKCPGWKKILSPEEISGWILRKLIEDAKDYLGQDIKHAVITVPAYFNDAQRQGTIDAGKLAGVNVLRIINEPTAAALAYGLDKKINSSVLVFDLGGGTLDISVLEVGDGLFEVLGTVGNTYLGGDDFDALIVDWVLEDFEKKEGINLRDTKKGNKQAIQRITQAAEQAKIMLSSADETTINLPFITADDNGPKHIDIKLDRKTFYEFSDGLLDGCEKLLKDVLIDTQFLLPSESDQETEEASEIGELDNIILVGGSTRIPRVQELIEKVSGKTPSKSVNPDEVVALGAAIQGGVLTGEIQDVLLLDVTPLSLGIDTLGDILTKVIVRNTTIPVKKSQTFSTAYAGQTDADIVILQGDQVEAEDNTVLGAFQLSGIPVSSKEGGPPEIDITFDLDVDGILSVTAKERETGIEEAIQITGTTTLKQEEIDLLREQAENYILDTPRLNEIILQRYKIACLEAVEENVRLQSRGLTYHKPQKVFVSPFPQDESGQMQGPDSIRMVEKLNSLQAKYMYDSGILRTDYYGEYNKILNSFDMAQWDTMTNANSINIEQFADIN